MPVAKNIRQLARSLDLKQLRCFAGTVDAGSITRAAHQLHIAQPALSKRLADLERLLGVQLLERGPGGIQVTEHGHVLYLASKRILRDVEDMAVEVCGLATGPVGTVQFGCMESVSTLISYPLVVEVLKSLPQVRLMLMSGSGRDLYRRLNIGDLDFVLIANDDECAGVTRRALIREELFLIGPADEKTQALPATVSLQQLSELPLILPSTSSFSIRGLLLGKFAKANFEPRVAVEVDSLLLSKRLVLEGHGYGFFPWSVVSKEVEAGQLLLRRIAPSNLERELAIYAPQHRKISVAATAVLDIMVGIVSGMIRSEEWQHVEMLRP